jgi:hypothetical protein
MPCVNMLQVVALLDRCYHTGHVCCGGGAAGVWFRPNRQVAAAGPGLEVTRRFSVCLKSWLLAAEVPDTRLTRKCHS